MKRRKDMKMSKQATSATESQILPVQLRTT
jgi:hypothetical protein